MDAFESLRAPVLPADPDRRFVERLHADLVAALSPTIDLPDRSHVMPTTTVSDSDTETATDNAVTLMPYLAVRGAADAIAWYVDVFDARETVRYTGDDGRIGHAELTIGDVGLALSDEYPDFGAVSPATLGGTSVALNLTVPDVDAVFARAVAAGADVQREPTDQPYGYRAAAFFDPWGHRWMVSSAIGEPTVEEIDAAMDGFTVTEPDA